MPKLVGYVTVQAELAALEGWLNTLGFHDTRYKAQRAREEVYLLKWRPRDSRAESNANGAITALRLALTSGGHYREANYLSRIWPPLRARVARERTSYRTATAVRASRFGLRGIGNYVAG